MGLDLLWYQLKKAGGGRDSHHPLVLKHEEKKSNRKPTTNTKPGVPFDKKEQGDSALRSPNRVVKVGAPQNFPSKNKNGDSDRGRRKKKWWTIQLGEKNSGQNSRQNANKKLTPQFDACLRGMPVANEGGSSLWRGAKKDLGPRREGKKKTMV